MSSLQGKMRQHTIIVMTLLFLFITGYLLTQLKVQFLSFFAGLSVSFLNLWTTYYLAKVVGKVADQKRKHSVLPFILAGFGYLIRIVLALSVVYWALINPDTLNVLLVIAGISLIYAIIMLDMLFQFMRKR
ncbi:ATP synthase subunit I [Alkalihalophilus marmarensis]|nr:ATP synthase subunit I [Alkalihalophilus marmarensis]pir/S17719/ H+-transporting two-sector ATPase (EC 3.6.3.14) chain I - Bacillus firmus [Cytobacillus firmus]MED1601647.1 ATP synthase subunit I [Alkalihalophilus marmarensis]